MKNASWDEYKKSITGLTEDQIKVMEDEAKRVAEELGKQNEEEAKVD